MYIQINVPLFYSTRVSFSSSSNFYKANECADVFFFQADKLCAHTHFVSCSALFYPVDALWDYNIIFPLSEVPHSFNYDGKYETKYRFRPDIRRSLQGNTRLDITRISVTVTFLVLTKAPANPEARLPCGDPQRDYSWRLRPHHAPYSIQPHISCDTEQICCVRSTWPSRLFSRLDHSRAKQIARWVPTSLLRIILMLLVITETHSWKSNYPESVRVAQITLITKRWWNKIIFTGVHK